MDLIELDGEIQDYYGNKLTEFNGFVNISVYDKSSELKTLDNDNYGVVKKFSLQKASFTKELLLLQMESLALNLLSQKIFPMLKEQEKSVFMLKTV